MRIAGFTIALAILAVGCTSPPAGSSRGPETRPALLAGLDGQWVMVGEVLGKPVRYSLVVSPVLAGSFTELHMTDVQSPPQYEARVFIAQDKDTDEIIVHWLDSFGGEGSIPHGTGQVTGDTIEFIIPYAEGPFRDRLTYDKVNGKWRFTVESTAGPERWKPFATYDLRREVEVNELRLLALWRRGTRVRGS